MGIFSWIARQCVFTKLPRGLVWWGFGLTQWHFHMGAGEGGPGLGHASIYLQSCASSHLSLLCSLGQGFYIQDFQSVAKNIMTELSFFCMPSQLSFLFQSLSTNITFPWLPWASFEATRAVAFSHGGQRGARVIASVTPGLIGSRPGGAPGGRKETEIWEIWSLHARHGGEAVFT